MNRRSRLDDLLEALWTLVGAGFLALGLWLAYDWWGGLG